MFRNYFAIKCNSDIPIWFIKITRLYTWQHQPLLVAAQRGRWPTVWSKVDLSIHFFVPQARPSRDQTLWLASWPSAWPPIPSDPLAGLSNLLDSLSDSDLLYMALLGPLSHHYNQWLKRTLTGHWETLNKYRLGNCLQLEVSDSVVNGLSFIQTW